MAADLTETGINDVLMPPAVPAQTSAEEACTSNAYSAPRDDPLGLSAARLKQLELESSPRSAAFAKNTNVNMVMNNQEDIVKIAEKCVLSSTGSSPEFTPLRTPDNIKSNILKAQVEAAAMKECLGEHVAVTGDKNCNLPESSTSGGPDAPDLTWDLMNPAPLPSLAAMSSERLSEDPIPLKTPTESSIESFAAKVKSEEGDMSSLAAPLTDNLIDFTDPVAVIPVVQPPKPVITPRWIIPSTTPACVFANGLLDLDSPADRGAAMAPVLPANTCSVVSSTCVDEQSASEDVPKARGLLTTEL